jgi:hypothetical protein
MKFIIINIKFNKILHVYNFKKHHIFVLFLRYFIYIVEIFVIILSININS